MKKSELSPIEFKKRIVAKILEQLTNEMNVMQKAAREAREAATHEESVAEDKYDTRGLEASYLAGAQAKRAAELEMMIEGYRTLPLASFERGAAIKITALIVLRQESTMKENYVFLAPKGGGMNLDVDGTSVQIITPTSVLGAELVGRAAGDEFEVTIAGQLRAYTVASVA